MYLVLRKCKNDCKILTIILVPDFCPLKAQIARFTSAFRLNLFVFTFMHSQTEDIVIG